MKLEVNVKWNGGMSFESVIDGHKMVIDSTPENGGNNTGPRPKALLMLSLAGCTGMDVISLMNKMRVEYTALNIKVQGDLAEDHPKKYNAIHVVFEVIGNKNDIEKIEKAVKLSEERYCGVWATLKPAVKMSYEVRFVN